MAIGLLGTKLGMTQIFDQESGLAIPVTVVQAGPCTVTQVKTSDTDGYSAIQIGYLEVKEKALTKPELGHLKKAESSPLRHLKEYRVDDTAAYELGSALKADVFNTGDIVDVAGTSMGRGFAGYQKRHNFKRGNMTHGSKNHRLPGSTGAGTTPGRVYPGKRMAGQYGATQVTTRHLQVIRVDAERNLLLIKGAVPGKKGSLLSITPTKTVGK
ncbi:50S ribosomal protein L3 [Crocosphaera sp. XPORK-15E]|uniref:50S ribosomal protein L3 n=1 Tax=Crocosphaera sp. XPORK-15E TaxID=3110247 RepID=UPI002B210638|nr:50S ribosomal protein L3 [Crocosphaera sp. XPORK-15E]MEA5532712.1 50S ribosomal protein L3 [Crocosphaera sp. XPORK-15E]